MHTEQNSRRFLDYCYVQFDLTESDLKRVMEAVALALK